MSEGNTACNVAFSAIGADPALGGSVTSMSPEAYRGMAYSVTINYLSAIKDRDTKKLTDPAYIKQTLPALMRAGYLRPRLKVDIKQLDLEVNGFVQAYAEKIAVAFAKGEAFDGKFKSLDFFVSREGVRLNFAGLAIETIYMPEPER
jgi:hypothetical protein